MPRWPMAQVLKLLTAAAFLMAAQGAPASDFTCGSWIISVGAHKNDVLRKCGAPSYSRSWVEEIIVGDLRPLEERRPSVIVKKPISVEEWEYNFGPTTFIRYLRFENDLLKKITVSDSYGY